MIKNVGVRNTKYTVFDKQGRKVDGARAIYPDWISKLTDAEKDDIEEMRVSATLILLAGDEEVGRFSATVDKEGVLDSAHGLPLSGDYVCDYFFCHVQEHYDLQK